MNQSLQTTTPSESDRLRSACAALQDLLRRSFTAVELHRLLADFGGPDLVDALPPLDSTPLGEYVYHAVATLQRHGLLADDFFHRLCLARPRLAKEIGEVQSMFPMPGRQEPELTRAKRETKREPFFSLKMRIGHFELIVAFGAFACTVVLAFLPIVVPHLLGGPGVASWMPYLIVALALIPSLLVLRAFVLGARVDEARKLDRAHLESLLLCKDGTLFATRQRIANEQLLALLELFNDAEFFSFLDRIDYKLFHDFRRRGLSLGDLRQLVVWDSVVAKHRSTERWWQILLMERADYSPEIISVAKMHGVDLRDPEG